ncbi:MAG: TolC family outer membrane protein [Kiloniellales bacterium]
MRVLTFTAVGLALAAAAFAASKAQATSLEEAVQSAIVFHPRIQRDEARERVAEQEIEVSYSRYLPRVDVDSAIGYEATHSPVTRSAGKGWRDFVRTDNRATLSQMIVDGGATPGLVAAARANHLATKGDLRETSELIAIDTVQLYLNLLRDQEFVRIAEENVAAHQGLNDRIRGLVEAGRGSDADIAQADSRLALARATLEDRRGGLREVIARYIETVGAEPGVLEPTRAPDYGEPATVDEAIAIAMENNPSVQATAARVTQAEHEIRVARASYYPRLDAEVFGSVNKNQDGTPGYDSDLNARLRGQWNIFNGFGDVARARRAEMQRNAQQGTLGDEARRVREETRIVWEALQTQRERVVPLREHLSAQERTLQSYLGQFDVGRRSLLDLLDSQNEAFQARTQLADAEFDLAVAEYELIFVTGRLLNTLGVVVLSEEDDHLERDQNR